MGITDIWQLPFSIVACKNTTQRTLMELWGFLESRSSCMAFWKETQNFLLGCPESPSKFLGHHLEHFLGCSSRPPDSQCTWLTGKVQWRSNATTITNGNWFNYFGQFSSPKACSFRFGELIHAPQDVQELGWASEKVVGQSSDIVFHFPVLRVYSWQGRKKQKIQQTA